MWLGHANRTPNVAPMRADRNGAGWWDKGNIVAPSYAGFFFLVETQNREPHKVVIMLKSICRMCIVGIKNVQSTLGGPGR